MASGPGTSGTAMVNMKKKAVGLMTETLYTVRDVGKARTGGRMGRALSDNGKQGCGMVMDS